MQIKEARRSNRKEILREEESRWSWNQSGRLVAVVVARRGGGGGVEWLQRIRDGEDIGMDGFQWS